MSSTSSQASPIMSAELSAASAAERKASLIWTGGIITFFVIQAILWAVALYITNNDLSHAIIPGYDQRALAWDAEAQAIAHSRELGWQVQIEVADTADARGQRLVTVRLLDRNGAALDGAKVEASYFHQARAALRETAAFTQSGGSDPSPGQYSAVLPINRNGLWRFEMVVELGLEKFSQTQQTFVTVRKRSR